MPCPEFENRLLDYGELGGSELAAVDAHLAACPDCRAFLESLARLDSLLAQRFGQAQVSRDFPERVLRRAGAEVPLRKPSWIPEALDFVGWAAVVAIAAALLWTLPLPLSLL